MTEIEIFLNRGIQLAWSRGKGLGRLTSVPSVKIENTPHQERYVSIACRRDMACVVTEKIILKVVTYSSSVFNWQVTFAFVFKC